MNKSQRSALRLLAVRTLVIIASAGTAVTAQAAYIATATETGGDVVVEGSGSLDLSAWSYASTSNRGGGILPASLFAIGGSGSVDRYASASNFSGPSSIGPGSSFTATSSGTGDYTGLGWVSGSLYVPNEYTSGNSLLGSGTFVGQTFSSLGLSTGVYQWTWGTGASADSFKLNVGAVPIPAAVWLFGSGLLGLVGVARRKNA